MSTPLNMPHAVRRLRAARSGNATVEFALACLAFLPFCFGTLEMGLMLWTQNSLQSIATTAARCKAMNAVACSAGVPAYVVSLTEASVMPGIIDTSNVTVSTTGNCNGAAGTATVVTITHSFWGSAIFPPPLANLATTVSGCYPTAA
jgi:Flp pilus assembly protein TadG